MDLKPIRYRNEYYCDRCKKSWQRYAETERDDRCPNCHATLMPLRSERIFGMLELTAFVEMSESQIARGLLGWIEHALVQEIKTHLDRENPIHFETLVNLQFRPQELRFIRKEGDDVWIVTRDILKVFNESSIGDRSMISVYDLIWILEEIERQHKQGGQ